jgi:hypothetical protein
MLTPLDPNTQQILTQLQMQSQPLTDEEAGLIKAEALSTQYAGKTPTQIAGALNWFSIMPNPVLPGRVRRTSCSVDEFLKFMVSARAEAIMLGGATNAKWDQISTALLPYITAQADVDLTSDTLLGIMSQLVSDTLKTQAEVDTFTTIEDPNYRTVVQQSWATRNMPGMFIEAVDVIYSLAWTAPTTVQPDTPDTTEVNQ